MLFLFSQEKSVLTLFLTLSVNVFKRLILIADIVPLSLSDKGTR